MYYEYIQLDNNCFKNIILTVGEIIYLSNIP